MSPCSTTPSTRKRPTTSWWSSSTATVRCTGFRWIADTAEFGHTGAMVQISTVTVKIAGAIMLVFGIGLAILAAWILERQIALHPANVTLTVAVLLVLV